MRNIRTYACFIVALVATVSCQKEAQIIDADEQSKPDMFQGLKRFPYKPTVFNLSSFSNEKPEGIVNDRKQNTVIFLRDSIWPNGTGKTSFYESTELPAILPETRIKLYLGAIIRGDQAVDVDNFTPLQIAAVHRNPITMYANFPTDSIFRTVLPAPSQDARYVRDALLAGTGQQIQSFTYEQSQFRKVEELKKSFGANLKIGNILTADFLDTTSSGNNKTRVRAEFTQENFTVAIEPPIYEPFLKPTFDVTQFGGYDPLIVSSVTYGRKGIFMLESDSTYEMVRQTLNVALTLSAEMIGISSSNTLGENFSIELGARMSNEQKAVIENSKIYVYVIGVDGTSTVRAVTGGLAGFAQIIAQSGGFTPQSPGAPLYYTLNYLSDFGTFRNPFQVHVSND
ncbi:thiol-activated cytolysin family protein [Sphingobacterium griseoflavum]|uniref:Hemolysin n=1 Tax=Sphingobacterium griseoflavum TaxID=1474952 RepID=A0ABQ3I047_9SPHI|nr:thiol-activated cytolysin family protein [Sphingobacterium griseoflavum]GHE49359.1 hemolysin [Sphingobacterium griseoflavum]